MKTLRKFFSLPESLFSKKNPTRSDRGRFSPQLEPLEERQLLSVSSSLLGGELVDSQIDTPYTTTELSLQVSGNTNPTTLGIRVDALDSQFDPDTLHIFKDDASRTPVNSIYSNKDHDGRASLILAELGPGNYIIEVGGEQDSTGAFFADVFLPGNTMNGTDPMTGGSSLGQVTTYEAFLAQAALQQSGQATGGYASDVYAYWGINLNQNQLALHPELDVNLDGQFTVLDFDAISRNMNDGKITVKLIADQEAPLVDVTINTDYVLNNDSLPLITGTDDPLMTFDITDEKGSMITSVDLGTLSFGPYGSATAQITLSEPELIQALGLTGTQLADGEYTLSMTTKDEYDNVATTDFTFFMLRNNTAPTVQGELLAISEDATSAGSINVLANDTTGTGETNDLGDALAVVSPASVSIDSITVYDASNNPIADLDLQNAGIDLTTLLGSLNGNGSLTANADGTVTFDPNGQFEWLGQGMRAELAVGYTAVDLLGEDGSATLTINVNGVNDAPTAALHSVTTNEDTEITAGDVSVKFVDIDFGDTVTVTTPLPTTSAEGAAVTIDANGGFTYDPTGAASLQALAAGESVTDSFTYYITDGKVATAVSATVEIDVDGLNDAPVLDGAATITLDDPAINEDATEAIDVTATINEIIARYSDVDNGAVLHAVVTAKAGGTADAGTLVEDEDTWLYTPAAGQDDLKAGEELTDLFTVSVLDEHDEPAAIDVELTIIVNGVNDAPVANGTTVPTDEDTSLTNVDLNALVSDIDGDSLTIQDGTLTSVQGAAVTIHNDGTFSYDPIDAATLQALADGVSLTDSFTYVVDDGTTTTTGTVTITVTGVNDAPEADSASITITHDDLGTLITEDIGGTIDLTDQLLANITDIDNPQDLAITSITQTGGQTYGTIELSNGQAILTLAAGAQTLAPPNLGDITFDYTVDDGFTETPTNELAAASGTIRVTGVNDDPVANPITVVSPGENQVLPIPATLLLSNDTDIDGGTLSILSINDSSLIGTLTDNLNGTYSYNPGTAFDYLNEGETATDTFTYTISDGQGGTSQSATVTITLTGENDLPVLTQNISSISYTDNIGKETIVPNVFSLTDADNDANDDVPTASLLSATLIISGQSDTDITDITGNVTVNSDGTVTIAADSLPQEDVDYTLEIDLSVTDNYMPIPVIETISLTVIKNNLPTAQNVNSTIDLRADDFVTINVTDLLNLADDVEDGPGTNTGSGLTINYNGSNYTYGDTFDLSVNSNDYIALGDGVSSTTDPTFSYTVLDQDGGESAAATITVDIIGKNDAPTANSESTAIDLETATSITIPVLDNDTDPDIGDNLFITSGSGGHFTVNSDGTFTFNPGNSYEFLAEGETAQETFSYTVSDRNDGTGLSDTASVTVMVTGQNEMVSINEQNISQQVNTIDHINGDLQILSGLTVTDVDLNDTHTFSITGATAGGVSITDPATVFTIDPNTGELTLKADSSLNENDQLTYVVTVKATNTVLASDNDTTTITISVVPNAAPVANDDDLTGSYTIDLRSGNYDITIPISVLLGNDSDAEDGSVLFNAATGATVNGQNLVLSIDPETYKALGNGETDTATFTYTAKDSQDSVSNVATVTIEVIGKNDAPVAAVDPIVINTDPVGGAILIYEDSADMTRIGELLIDNVSDPDTNDTLTPVDIMFNPEQDFMTGNYDGRYGTLTWDAVNEVAIFTPGPENDTLPADATFEMSMLYSVSDGTVTETFEATLVIHGTDDATETVGTIPGATLDRTLGAGNGDTYSIDLDDYFSDPDSTLTYDVQLTGGSLDQLTGSPVLDPTTNVLTFTASQLTDSYDPNAVWGDLTFQIEAKADGVSTGVTQDVTIDFTPKASADIQLIAMDVLPRWAVIGTPQIVSAEDAELQTFASATDANNTYYLTVWAEDLLPLTMNNTDNDINFVSVILNYNSSSLSFGNFGSTAGFDTPVDDQPRDAANPDFSVGFEGIIDAADESLGVNSIIAADTGTQQVVMTFVIADDLNLDTPWLRNGRNNLLGYIEVTSTTPLSSDEFSYDLISVSRGVGPVATDASQISSNISIGDQALMTAKYTADQVTETGVYMNIAANPTITDANGQVDSMPSSTKLVSEWQTHYAEIWVKADEINAAAGAVADLAYDPQLFTATSIEFGPAFTEAQNGVIDDEAGTITGISAQLADGAVIDSNDGLVLLGRVKFESLEDNNMTFGEKETTELGTELTAASLIDHDGELTAVVAGTESETLVHVLPFDTNDDGQIAFNDMVQYIRHYGFDTSTEQAGNQWAMDSDRSGMVDFGDITSMIRYYGTGKGSSQFTSDAFTKTWASANLDLQGNTTLDELIKSTSQDWQYAANMDSPIDVRVVVKDLGGSQLGSARITELDENGLPAAAIITIDDDAAGFGWYADSNTATPNDKYDLESVLLHEMGHAYGFTMAYSGFQGLTSEYGNGDYVFSYGSYQFDLDATGHHLDASVYDDDLMTAEIAPGEQRSISLEDKIIVLLSQANADAAAPMLNTTPAYMHAVASVDTITVDASQDVAASIESAQAALEMPLFQLPGLTDRISDQLQSDGELSDAMRDQLYSSGLAVSVPVSAASQTVSRSWLCDMAVDAWATHQSGNDQSDTVDDRNEADSIDALMTEWSIEIDQLGL